MLRTVFTYEWRWLLRNPAIWFSLLLFTVIGLLAVNRGVSYLRYQQQETDSITVRHARAYTKLKAGFDTLDFSRKERYAEEDPWSLDWSLWEYAAKPLNPLAALYQGQNDLQNRHKRTRFATDIFTNELDEFRNPELLLSGNLDLAYYLLFLFPLLFIAISYNVVSADREAGIHFLIAAQSGHGIRFAVARLLFRWMISLTPFLISLGFALSQIAVMDGFRWTSFLSWTIIAFMYSLLWLGIGYMVILRNWTSMVNALTLTGIWLLLLVGIPGIINSWMQLTHPTNLPSEVTALRDDKHKYADLSIHQHRTFFLNSFTALRKDIALIDTVEMKWASYALMSLEREKEIHTNWVNESEKAEATERAFLWINPAGAFLRAFSELGGSTLRHQQLFERIVLDLREKKLKYLFTAFFTGDHFDNKDFAGIPRYTTKPTQSESLLGILFPAIILTILIWLLVRFRESRRFSYV